MKVEVHSPDENTDFSDITAGIPQGDILALYLLIICLDCVLQTLIDRMKRNGFTLKEARSRWYHTETIMDANYVDDSASYKCSYSSWIPAA